MRTNDISGIYEIRNVITNDFYIGSSRNCGKRFSTHYRELKLGIHDNSKLQNSWNKYGETNFYFSTLIECDVDSLFQVEQQYINTLNPQFNIAREVGIPNTPKAGTIEAMERSKKGQDARKKSEWCNSPEFHEMMSNIRREAWQDPTHRESRSVETKELWNNTNYRERQKHAHRKIDEINRIRIREMKEQGYRICDIMLAYQISRATVTRIIKGLH